MTDPKLDSFETALLTELRTVRRGARGRSRTAPIAPPARPRRASPPRPPPASRSSPCPAPARRRRTPSRRPTTAPCTSRSAPHATPEALEAAFADHGITADVTYLDRGMTCDGSRGTPGTMPVRHVDLRHRDRAHDGFAIDIPAGLPGAGETLVLAATRPSDAPDGPGRAPGADANAGMGFVTGDVSPCDPVAIPE